tara:strand:- start:451 stop:675 length:225 start_codon:yes stop_codon:yes gene_type:complete
MKKILNYLKEKNLYIILILTTSLSSCYEYHTEIVNRTSKTNPFSDKTYEEVIIYKTNKITGEIIKMDEDLNGIK